MKQLSRENIRDGLSSLGLRRGMVVMAHASLAGFGGVEGGADAVIDALLEVLGNRGTLMMPSFSSPDRVFDYRKSPCGLGKIPDMFWRRKGVLRSLHPSHSVAAFGELAEHFIVGHEKASTAYGADTPYKRLIDKKGFVLMLGVDLDRMTLLHTVEAFAGAPYLKTVKKKYVDAKGDIKEAVVEKMAGPHRNFIGLDGYFREHGIMKTGKTGNAVCRLIDAAGMFDCCLERMKNEPDLMLCGNPSCGDCGFQRGKIRERALSEEDFELIAQIEGRPSEYDCGLIRREGITGAAVAGGRTGGLKEIGGMLDKKGMKAAAVNFGTVDIASDEVRKNFIEIAAEEARALETDRLIFSIPACSAEERKTLPEAFRQALAFARDNNFTFLLENGLGDAAGLSDVMDIIEQIKDDSLRLACNPANFAFEGGKPFLDFVRKLKHVGALYINDGIKNSPGGFCLPGQGNAEIKEIISALRARSFNGLFILKADVGAGESFKDHAGALRKLLSEM